MRDNDFKELLQIATLCSRAYIDNFEKGKKLND